MNFQSRQCGVRLSTRSLAPTANHLRRCWALTLMALVIAGGVHAYVLPAPHVLDLMITNLGKAGSLEVSQKNIFLRYHRQAPPCGENDANCSDQATVPQGQSVANASLPQPLEIKETVRYAFPQAFRSDTHGPPTDRTHIFRAGRSVTVVDGTVAGDPESNFDLYKHLLLHRSRSTFMSRLAEHGVDTNVCSLGRFEGRIAFVLGAVYPDMSLPQVWVDKETLLPIRWIVQGANPGEETTRFEIRYLEWRWIEPIWYPDHIEFVRNGTPVRLIQVEDVVLNPTFSQDLFSVDGLLARSQPAGVPLEEGGSKRGGSEIQRTIEEFKRLFE